MTYGRIVTFAFLVVFGVALFQCFQVLDLKKEIHDKNAHIYLLNDKYNELESDFTVLEAGLNRTLLDLERVNASLEKSEASLREIRELYDTRSIHTHILGVRDGKGVPIPLEIEIKKGTGGIFVDIEEIFLEGDVQSTAKTAFALADVMSDGGLAEKDATIRIVNPYTKSLSISGMSSGAIMTMALITLGKNTTLKKDVMITGTIKGDGSIGPVLYISQKAESAKELNATVMLVPVGQKISVSGIELIEISDIEEAMEYMLE